MKNPPIGRTITDTLITAFHKWYDRPYIWTLSRGQYQQKTYGDIIGSAFALAEELAEKGVLNQNVAIFAGSSYRWAVVDYAIALSSNVAVLMDATWQLLEAKNAAIFVKPKVLFYDKSTKKVVDELRALMPDTIFWQFDALPAPLISVPQQLPRRSPDKVAKIFFSSGTTGMPKAIQLSETNMLFGWRELERRMHGVGPSDTCYVFIPFHHVYANVTILLYALPIGCQLYLSANIKDAKHEMALVRPTIIHGVPLFFERIFAAIPPKDLRKAQWTAKAADALRAPRGLRRKLFAPLHNALGGRVKYLISGGAALDPDLHAFFKGAGLFILAAYGSTETAGGMCSMDLDTNKHATVGAPYQGVDMKIFQPDSQGVGEVVVKGPNIFRGYYNNAKATTAVFDVDGYFHTGDIGRFDEDGELYIVGRKKRMILLSNGENVWLDEIEKLFKASSAIVDARLYEQDGMIHAMITIRHKKHLLEAEGFCHSINQSLSKRVRVTRFRFAVYDEMRRLK